MPELLVSGGLTLTDNGDGTETLDGGMPSGVILMWSGSIASIPSGWALCDGSNGTPDLRDRFLVGAGNAYAPGATGGEDSHQLTTAELPAHSHSVDIVTSAAGAHAHTVPVSSGPAGTTSAVGVAGTASGTIPTSSEAAHTHDVSGNTGSTGSDGAHENRPPYYALALIMRL